VASRKRPRVQPARSDLDAERDGFLPNIGDLIDAGGQISVGAIGPITCAAVANDADQCYAMLQRRPGETLQQLLERPDVAIGTAIETEEMIDDINASASAAREASRRY
jgi:hypothetical protein